MENLPADVWLHIFCLLDHQNLAIAQKVCKKWKSLGSNNDLWCNLFKDRWGGDAAAFFAPIDEKTWKHVYEVQDRCDRVGLGVKIIRQGGNYYAFNTNTTDTFRSCRGLKLNEYCCIPCAYRLEIQKCSTNEKYRCRGLNIIREGADYYLVHQGQIQRYLGSRPENAAATSIEDCCSRGGEESIFDKILFFIGDLETDSKRARNR